MQTFVYKRTHKRDPRDEGIFGCEDCMGRLRNIAFDSVIGIGGIRPWPDSRGIERKINWVGTGARQIGWYARGYLIAFDHFVLLDEKGPELRTIAPVLARLLLRQGARWVFSQKLTKIEQSEVRKILRLAENAPKSRKFKYALKKKPCSAKQCVPFTKCA